MIIPNNVTTLRNREHTPYKRQGQVAKNWTRIESVLLTLDFLIKEVK